MRIGVLALQGDFARHAEALRRCRSASGDPRGHAAGGEAEIEVVEVRKPEHLRDIDGLIVPGGESTTLVRLMDDWGFVPALRQFHESGRPMFGTCAGAILLAREVENPQQFSLGFIDIAVERNAYGRQRESFVAPGHATLRGEPVGLEMVFIRAPRIRRMGSGVEALARYGGEPVLAQQGSVLVGTFHPELTDDSAVHRHFCQMVRQWRTESQRRAGSATRSEPARESDPTTETPGELVRGSRPR